LGALSGVSPKSGFLLLRPQAKRLILLDLDEVIIDARYLLENEEVQSGSKIEMTSHIVSVGVCLLEGDVTPPFAQPTSVHHHNLAPSLDFAKGLQFEKNIRSKFGHSINFTEGFRRREFVLVISFGRSKFKLDVHTVGIMLQACFGGIASLFHVKLLRDRTFRFAVASRSVGFQIYNIGKFSDKDFEFFVNLWGEGGPNWKFEESKYYIEQELEWTKVKIKKSSKSSVFKRLSFHDSDPGQIGSPPSLAQPKFIANKLAISNTSNAAIVSDKIISSNNVPSFGREKITGRVMANQIWVPKPPDRQSGAKVKAQLPGLLPFMKFASFPKVEWPDESYRNWFKAHGPPIQIKQATNFKELGHCYLRPNNIPISSTSWHTIHYECIASIPSPSWPAAEALQMANIPIDPRQFIPRGFQIRHVPGRNAVKKVVVARRPKAHEEFAIVTITPFPPGQVLFENVSDVLQEFLVHMPMLGFLMSETSKLALSVLPMLGFLMSEIGTVSSERVQFLLVMCTCLSASTMRV
jgi:hypothetical protein